MRHRAGDGGRVRPDQDVPAIERRHCDHLPTVGGVLFRRRSEPYTPFWAGEKPRVV